LRTSQQPRCDQIRHDGNQHQPDFDVSRLVHRTTFGVTIGDSPMSGVAVGGYGVDDMHGLHTAMVGSTRLRATYGKLMVLANA